MGAAAPCTHARAYTSLCARNARGFGPRTCMRRPLPLHSRGSQTECSVSTARGTTNTTKKCCCCALSRARKPSSGALGGPILPFSIFGGDVTHTPTETCVSKGRRSKRARGRVPSREQRPHKGHSSHSTFLFFGPNRLGAIACLCDGAQDEFGLGQAAAQRRFRRPQPDGEEWHRPDESTTNVVKPQQSGCDGGGGATWFDQGTSCD